MLTEILIFIIVCFSAYECYAHQLERRRAIERERELLTAIMSKDLGQYTHAIDALKRTPKDKLNELKAENELAQAAVKLEGIPVR